MPKYGFELKPKAITYNTFGSFESTNKIKSYLEGEKDQKLPLDKSNSLLSTSASDDIESSKSQEE